MPTEVFSSSTNQTVHGVETDLLRITAEALGFKELDPLLTVIPAAGFLGLRPSTIRCYISNGPRHRKDLRVTRMGGRTLFHLSDLLAFREAARVVD